MVLLSKEKDSEESGWLGSRRINSRGRKSLIFLHMLLYAIMKYLVIGMLTAVVLFGKALRGTTLQIDPSWICCISILYPHQPGHRQRGMLITTVPLLPPNPPISSLLLCFPIRPSTSISDICFISSQPLC